MKKNHLVALILAIILTGLRGASPIHASGSRLSPGLCIPEFFSPAAEGCLNLGPSQYLKDSAASGISLPLQPVPGWAPDAELRVVPNFYAQVVRGSAPVFGSLANSVSGESPLYFLEAGFDYVSYIDRAEVDGAPFYMIDQGVWMRGEDLSRISAMPNFQGRQFSQTPTQDFGWVLFEVQSQKLPGYENRNQTIRIYYRYTLVQIYRIEQIGDLDWYLIGPDEWVEGRQVARVTPNPTPPEGVSGGRWVEVNLAEQTVAVYENEVMIFATVISSGIPGQWTQPGLFQAYKKKANETMSGSFTSDRSDFYYLEDVPWTIYFDQSRAFHGTYWHNGFGVPQSRGCVNLSPGDARWVFDWIEEGDWIFVWDPTGETPTDPALYGSGGA
jgi:hypothetical protein